MAQLPITTLIWDLGGTLFAPDLNAIDPRSRNYYALLSYMYGSYQKADHGYLLDAEKKAIEILDRLGKQNGDSQHLIRLPNGQPAPQIVCNWLAGTISNEQALEQALNEYSLAIQDGHFLHDGEKNIVKSMLHALFNPQALIDCMQPIKSMVTLLSECFQKNKYTLYILSNWDRPSFDILYTSEKGQEVFKYFKKENILVSSMVGLIKPQKQIYTYFLDHYGINPQESLFIDNQEENIKAAQQFGITSLLFKPNGAQALKEQLKAFEII